MRRAVIFAVSAAVFAAMLGSAPNAWAVETQVVTDCNTHGQLTQPYTATQLREALATLPADVKEYTDCYDVIQRALLTELGGAGHTGSAGSGGGGGSFLPTPVIVVVALLVFTGLAFGLVAARRQRSSQPGGK